MKLKKFALRGLITLAVIVALCMFFANTVLTITTPKVQIVQASRGRLEQKMKLDTQVYFPNTTDYTLADATKSAITVDKVYVKPGHHVDKGETLFTAVLTDYDKDWKDLQGKYAEKAKALMDKDVENRRFARNSTQNDMYDAVLDVQWKAVVAEQNAHTLAYQQNITLDADSSKWEAQAAGKADLLKAVKAATDAEAAYQKAYDDFFASFDNTKIRVRNATFKFINERRAIIKEMNGFSDDLTALAERKISLSTVTAPQAGYVVAVNVKSGDSYDGKKAAFTLSGDEDAPVLRADVTSLNKAVADGAKVEVAGDYGSEKTTVEKTELDTDGKKYLYVTLTSDIITLKGGITRMLADGTVNVTLSYRAKDSTTLLPASAVRNEGEGKDYVYMIQRNGSGFLGSSSMTVVKTSVDVIERGDTMVSVRQQLDYQEIADREDRALKDGCTVMEYVE